MHSTDKVYKAGTGAILHCTPTKDRSPYINPDLRHLQVHMAYIQIGFGKSYGPGHTGPRKALQNPDLLLRTTLATMKAAYTDEVVPLTQFLQAQDVAAFHLLGDWSPPGKRLGRARKGYTLPQKRLVCIERLLRWFQTVCRCAS